MKDKFTMFLMLLLLMMTFSSCATLLSKKQTITVDSDVEGAAVYTGKKYRGVTPLTFKTKYTKTTLTISKAGYPTQKIYTPFDLRGNVLWNTFNGIGYVVDMINGAWLKYNTTYYYISLKEPEKNKNSYAMVPEVKPNKINGGELAAALLVGTLEGLAAVKQEEAARKQEEEAAREEQQRAQLQAMTAANKQKYAEFQAMTNKKTYSSNYQSNSSSYRTQGSYNDLLTSDPDWNKQVQMWVQQYGVEKTREIVRQKRANDYQQSVEVSRNYSQSQSNLQSNASFNNEKIISAVTSKRQHIKIKINGFGRITHYSNGLNSMGKPNWILITNPAGISQTRSGSIDSIDAEFSHTSDINGMKIYFNM